MSLTHHRLIGSVALLIMAAITPCLAGSLHGDLLNYQVQAISVSDQTIDEILGRIANENRIPVGLELVSPIKGAPEKKIALHLPETTLQELLDALVKQDPRYDYQVRNGVINVFPKSQRDALLSELLNTTVSHFSIPESTRQYRIKNNLMELPELEARMQQYGVHPLILANGPSLKHAGSGFSMNVSNVTLREILNQLIQTSEVKFWVLGWDHWGEDKFLFLRF